MSLLPNASESIVAFLKDCPIIRSCSPDDVTMDPMNGSTVAVEDVDVVVEEETNMTTMPHGPRSSCEDRDDRRSEPAVQQGSNKSLRRASSSTGTDIDKQHEGGGFRAAESRQGRGNSDGMATSANRAPAG